MQRLSLLVLSLLLPLIGCTSTRTVAPDSNAATYANLDLIGETVTIRLTNGMEGRGRFLGLYPDSTAWLDASGTRIQVPTREVAQVTRVSRFQGFMQGTFAGALLGGVSVGTLAHLVLRDGYGRENCDQLCGLAEVVTATLALAGAAGGGTIGGITGTVRGHRDTYRVVAPATTFRADSSLVYRRALPERGYSATTSNGLE
jgi:hypothetical protein